MKLLSIAISSVFLLTGCSAIAGADAEADGKACQELVAITSTDNLSLDMLDTAAIANEIRSKASSVAGEDFGTKITALADALEADPIDAAAITPVATEIALRCAVVGVTFDFSSVTQLLG